jgi:hypothetical protein
VPLFGFDEMAAKLHLFDHADRINARTLMVTGEYDPLSPLEDALEVFERVRGPKEMWVIEDAFHPLRNQDQFAKLNPELFIADWLRDALAGTAPIESGRKVLVSADRGEGMYGDGVAGYLLPERADLM